ncbi:MAG: hypothetical protein DHS20C11_25240 [Lysobacteraceae bacterium]|nr:MAG: hypothetical protein DHS20C11_25240 [Xanthomonadaceae bacterium]
MQMPFRNPYLIGIGIGVVLLLAFLLAGRGLGATGAYSTLVAGSVAAVAPDHVEAKAPYQAFLNEQSNFQLDDWLLVEIAGVLIGGLISAVWSGRFSLSIDKGASFGASHRLTYAACGGLLMGLGAKLARGCTSGQGLTGGAMFSTGAWLFIACAFAAAFLAAPWVRKQWI